MRNLVFSVFVQLFLLLLLFRNDKNDGEKKLFKKQHWRMSDVAIVALLINTLPLLFAFTLYIFSGLNVNIYAPVTNIHTFAINVALLMLLIVLFKFRFKKNVDVLGIETNNVRPQLSEKNSFNEIFPDGWAVLGSFMPHFKIPLNPPFPKGDDSGFSPLAKGS